MTGDNFLQAAISDLLNVTNSIFFPIPKETIKWAFKRLTNNPMNKYLNTDYEELLQFYDVDALNLLELSYNDISEPLPQQLVIDNTVQNLNPSHFIFTFDSTVFETNRATKDIIEDEYLKFIKTFNYNNGENLRLTKIEQKEDTYIFHTQPVYYETYLQTNMMMDHIGNGEKSLRQFIHATGQLEPLNESLLANHIGINILLFTPAGRLILPLRSDKVSYAPSELAASISGAVKSIDASEGKPIDENSIIREGLEELGVKRTEIIEGSIQFLGLTRELVRGGKPEIFFTMQTSLTLQEIRERWSEAEDKWESKALKEFHFPQEVLHPLDTDAKRKVFERAITEMFEKIGGNMSLPLLTNLALWIKMKREGN